MPAARLETPVWVLVALSEMVFPITDPAFDRFGCIGREAEAVEVVGHQEVVGNEPCGGFAPGLFDVLLRGLVSEPRGAVFGGDCEENAGGVAGSQVDTGGWVSAAERWVHAERFWREEGEKARENGWGRW